MLKIYIYIYKRQDLTEASYGYLTTNWSLIRLILKVSLIVDIHIYMQKSLPAKMSEIIEILIVRQL